MPGKLAVGSSRLFVAVNPHSKTGADTDLHALFPEVSIDTGCVIHRLTANQQLTEVAREAARAGFDIVAAAGGDGTVAQVATGLIGTNARLGIIPLGTSNVLARELKIPLDPAQAVKLLCEPFAERTLDAMKVGDQYLFTQIGIGVNALAIQGASAQSKRRFGRFAYFWAGVKQLLGYNPTRFTIKADDVETAVRAVQVMVINSSEVGTLGIQWGHRVQCDDGEVEVCIMRGKTALDYAGMWLSLARRKPHLDRRIKYLRARQRITVRSHPPLPVQGDGEILGDTPLHVEVVPSAVRVLVPADAE
jgi:YegS/Rv2252/BmrU family lipid kinase